ncbi:MAG: phosphatidylserine decarboxylase [Gammaproteobacteria bacterium]|jgi:phosphatidylserine decarboxylase
MSVSTHTLIAQEGVPMIFGSILVAGILSFAYGVIITPVWLLVLVVIWLYRDPVRKVPSSPRGVISPVEGSITVAEPHPDPYLGRDAQLVRIHMALTSVYSIRGAVEGKIIQQWLDQESKGKHDIAHAIQIKTDEEDDVVVVLRPGRIFKRLNCEANIGERIGQGHRCGIIPFGSEVDVYLPINASLNVTQGDKVVSGETILAELSAQS